MCLKNRRGLWLVAFDDPTFALFGKGTPSKHEVVLYVSDA